MPDTDAAPESPGYDLSRRDADSIDVSDVKTIEDAAAIWGNDVETAADAIGDGFTQIDNKDQLLDTPFFIVKFKFVEGDFGGDFVLVWVVTENGKKLRFADGSTGIMAQLAEFASKRKKYGGLLCKGGLTRSDYKYTNPQGTELDASTYYIVEGK